MLKQYPIVGMHCASCKNAIENSVKKLRGVSLVDVNFNNELLTIDFDPNLISLDRIEKAVSDAGPYKLVTKGDKTVLADPANKDEMPQNSHVDHLKEIELAQIKKNLIITGIFTFPFFVIMFLMPLGLKEDWMGYLGKFNIFYLIQFILSTLILFYGAKTFIISAYKASKQHSVNMDTLTSLGILSAWIFSTLTTFSVSFSKYTQNRVFFEAVALLTFFILLGRYLETRAKSKTKEAIEKLAKLQTKKALLKKDKKEIWIDISEVKVGDLLIVKPGSKIPTDGIIVEGEASIDESMVTGESIPVYKKVNDKVIGGTINKSGHIIIKATRIGKDTMLASIIQLVQNAQMAQPKIQKIADKISSIFVPTVIIISILVFLFWFFLASQFGLVSTEDNLIIAVYTFMSILVIACPCALGIATPTAVMVTSGVAAKKGILIKDITKLEILNKAKTYVFDKTGTLTKGKLRVTKFKILNDKFSKKIISEIIYAVESKSMHPISKAIVKYFSSHKKSIDKISIEKFKEIEGKGLTAKIKGYNQILIGNKKLLDDNKIDVKDEIYQAYKDLQSKGETVIFVVIDKVIVAFLSLTDEVKLEAQSIVKKLQNRDIKVIMLTGDNEKVAKSLAQKLNIEYKANVLPKDKLEIIKSLQKGSKFPVVMIGDGINDAPALAQADVSIAMGDGTDVSISAGDIVILNGDLNKLPQLINLTKLSLKIIKQNLAWAFGYNIVAIPIAAGILYPFGILLSPIITSIAMSLSSISVVLNSLRINYFLKTKHGKNI